MRPFRKKERSRRQGLINIQGTCNYGTGNVLIGKNLCIETEPIKIKSDKNNWLQPYLSTRHLLDDHNILDDT